MRAKTKQTTKDFATVLLKLDTFTKIIFASTQPLLLLAHICQTNGFS